MKQDNTPRDYTQLMSKGMWEKMGDDMCSPEEVISFLNGGGAFRSFGDGLIWVITQKMPSLTGYMPKEICSPCRRQRIRKVFYRGSCHVQTK